MPEVKKNLKRDYPIEVPIDLVIAALKDGYDKRDLTYLFGVSYTEVKAWFREEPKLKGIKPSGIKEIRRKVKLVDTSKE